MKATGIVRRIDDLGRVVIPKEIRRTMKIREGEPLEIYTDAGGSVIFRKYSPAGELSGLAGHLCDAVYKICGRPLVICDRDSIIAAAGTQKKELDGKPITQELEELMQARQIQKPQPAVPVTVTVPGVEASLVAPIIAGGDLSGCVAFLAWDAPPGEWDIKLAQTAATFLSKQMED